MASLMSFPSKSSNNPSPKFDIGTNDLSELAKPLNVNGITWILGKSHTIEVDWREDFESILWCSYRKSFPQMNPYPITSDSGWGCMLRASQMIMAQGIKNHSLGRNWKPRSIIYNRKNEHYYSLIKLFVDQPGEEYLYSIHNMINLGLAKYDKLPGEWYGPLAAAYVLRGLSEVGRIYHNSGFGLVVSNNGVMYIDEILKMASSPSTKVKETNSDNFEKEIMSTEKPPPNISSPNSVQPRSDQSLADPLTEPLPHPLADPLGDALSFDPLFNPGPRSTSNVTQPPIKEAMEANDDCEWLNSVMVLIPVRLGLNSLNAEYCPALLKMLEMPQSLGFIGGWPNHAVYFVGHQGSSLIGLDPHTTQVTPPLHSPNQASEDKTSYSSPSQNSNKNDGNQSVSASYPLNHDSYLESLTCHDVQQVQVLNIDPSLALGFIFKSHDDLNNWLVLIDNMSKELGLANMPFLVERCLPWLDDDVDDDDDDDGCGAALSPKRDSLQKGNRDAIVDDDPEDDFVLL